MTGADCKTIEYFSRIFLDGRHRLEAVLRRYEVPAEEARGLLQETILELIYQGEGVGEPGPWLAARLTHKCRRYWVKRRRLLAQAVACVFPALPPDIEPRTTPRGAEDAQDPPG